MSAKRLIRMTSGKSFVTGLFAGRLEPGRLSPFPRVRAEPRELEALLELIRQSEGKPASGQGSSAGNGAGIDRLRRLGLLSASEPTSPLLLSRIVREIGGVDIAAALSFIAHTALGLRLLEDYGSAAQKAAIRRHPGGAVLAFALTEANPGSDVSQVQTYAARQGSGFVLHGTKHWVTNATEATHFIVLARTTPPSAGTKPRLTAFVVPRGPGVSVRRIESSVLPESSVAEVVLSGALAGADAVLGPVGKGFRVVMHGLAEARLLVGAAVLGACIRAFDETVERLNQRRAFGRLVGNFPSVQDRIASMLSDILALESLVHGAAGASEESLEPDAVERAVVRLAASRTSARALDIARELQGAAAFAGDSVASRRFADTRALTLLDGSDLALESFIILEGTRDVRQRLSAPPASGLLRSTFSDLSARARRVAQRALDASQKVQALGVLDRELAQRTSEFAFEVEEQIRRYGKDLVEMQHVQRRLAGIVTDLSTWYALSMRVASERQRHGETGSRRMSEAGEIWATSANARIQHELAGLSVNDDEKRDRIASRAYGDKAYPFDVV